MPEGTRWVGLDVHAAQTACAVFDRRMAPRSVLAPPAR